MDPDLRTLLDNHSKKMTNIEEIVEYVISPELMEIDEQLQPRGYKCVISQGTPTNIKMSIKPLREPESSIIAFTFDKEHNKFLVIQIPWIKTDHYDATHIKFDRVESTYEINEISSEIVRKEILSLLGKIL